MYIYIIVKENKAPKYEIAQHADKTLKKLLPTYTFKLFKFY